MLGGVQRHGGNAESPAETGQRDDQRALLPPGGPGHDGRLRLKAGTPSASADRAETSR